MAALRFRCPHCRQNTIEVRAKLKGAWWPGTCPQCGGRFVPWRLSRWELGSLAAAMAVVVLYAALKPDELPAPAPAARDAAAVSPIGTARHFSDPATQAGYKAALDKAGIPFTLYLSDGMEYVRVEREHAAALERVQREFLSKGGS
jgi:hypothetical protein